MKKLKYFTMCPEFVFFVYLDSVEIYCDPVSEITQVIELEEKSQCSS